MENDCHDVAIENTGVYWFPIYNVLESIFYEDGQVNIIVANPYHMKNVPGKKFDTNNLVFAIIQTLQSCGFPQFCFCCFSPLTLWDETYLTAKASKN